ncbi:MAG TPA: hypothetical protein VFK32_10490 [Tepidiformaceae bacterium]|nr:hypothetical protein [Tepidiformaceae bacterium]
MLRPNHEPSWWRRLLVEARVPDYIPIRPPEALRCPDCTAQYEIADRYCPGCHSAIPEWRYG